MDGMSHNPFALSLHGLTTMSTPEVFVGGNSIDTNPLSSNIDITRGTTDWLWAVFAIMALTDLVFVFLAFRRPVGTRVFHQLPVLILTTAAIAYFTMAADLGSTAIAVEYLRGASPGTTRAIWYVRYIDWTITTPLLLLELLLNTGLPLSDIVTVIFMDLVMIITGLVGALVVSRYKWAYFAFGCAALLYIWWILLFKGRAAARTLGNDVHRAYTGSTIFLMTVWLLYPIAWGLSDGGNRISPLGEMIFYGILDILAKPVFCFYHAFALRGIPYERFMLSSGKASIGYGALGAGANGAAGGLTEKGRGAHSNDGAAGVPGIGTNQAAGPGYAPNATGVGALNGRTGLGRTVSGRGAAEAGEGTVHAGGL